MSVVEKLSAMLRGDVVTGIGDVDEACISAWRDTADEQGVTPLVAASAAIRLLPDHLRHTFRTALREAIVLELIGQRSLRQLLTALDSAGIRCVVIKGNHLAYTHYAAPWLRPRADTDLLIAHRDRHRAADVLQTLGYAPQQQISGTLVMHQAQYTRAGVHGVQDVIDLHWKIANPQLFSDLLTFDELMNTACAIPGFEHGMCPSPVHALLIACLHRVAHHRNSELLIWLYDIHLLATKMTDVERRQFVELARVKRVRSICAAGLDSAQRHFGSSGDADWRENLGSREATDLEPTAAYLRERASRFEMLLRDLRAVSWTRKARLLSEHMFPSAAYVKARCGDDTPLVLAYANRIVNGASSWFRPSE
jgi:hypothetical protein